MLRSLDFDFAVAPARRSLETLGISSGGATSGAIRREEFPHVAPLAALHLTQTWLEPSRGPLVVNVYCVIVRL